jgi:hypothetical protein
MAFYESLSKFQVLTERVKDKTEGKTCTIVAASFQDSRQNLLSISAKDRDHVKYGSPLKRTYCNRRSSLVEAPDFDPPSCTSFDA